MRKTYGIRSITWSEEEYTDFETRFDADDIVEKWARFGDSNGWFIDGYPDDHEVEVRAPDGTLTRHTVSTDWSPDFYVYDKE